MLKAIDKAKLQLEVATNKFNWATGKDVEVATLELFIAEKKLNRFFEIAKEEGVRNEGYSI